MGFGFHRLVLPFGSDVKAFIRVITGLNDELRFIKIRKTGNNLPFLFILEVKLAMKGWIGSEGQAIFPVLGAGGQGSGCLFEA
jgi:hypothetical protein